MAFASDPDESLKCPVCVENYKEPRKLPGCSHSFCENCILTYVLKLKQEDLSGHEFQCPVCRLPTLVPENTDINIEWVRTMDKDAELESISNKQVTELDDGSCCRCKYLSKYNEAKQYCLNCQEYLCVDCSKILHASKLGKTHTLINAESSDKSNKLQSPALKLISELLTCKVHPENKAELHCELHDDLICITCAVVKHNNCKALKEVKDITKTSLQADTTALVSTADKLVEHMMQIIGVYKENEVEIKHDREKICAELQEIKQKVVRIFDTVEESLNQEAGAMTKNLTIKCLDEIEVYKSMIQDLCLFTQLIQKFLANASEDQVFVCTQKIKKKCHDIERKIIQRGAVFTKLGVELKYGKLLAPLLCLGPNDTEQLGAVKEKEKTVTIPHYENTHLERTYTIDHVGSQSIRVIAGSEEPTYNGLLYLPNNQILLTDSDFGYCCVINEQYQKIVHRKFVSKAKTRKGNMKMLQYATYMKNDLIAISMTTEKKLCFVSPENLTLKGEISCTRSPKAMCALATDNEIAIAWEDPVAFGIIAVQGGSYNETTYFTNDKADRQLKSFDYMAVDKKLGHIIQPCNVDKAVYCFNLVGEPVFSYENEELTKPSGVAVDADGKIYVCNKNSNGSIHILSPHGMPIRIFKEKCPSEPLAIGFNIEGNRFAVSQTAGNWDIITFFAVAAEDK